MLCYTNPKFSRLSRDAGNVRTYQVLPAVASRLFDFSLHKQKKSEEDVAKRLLGRSLLLALLSIFNLCNLAGYAISFFSVTKVRKNSLDDFFCCQVNIN